VQEDYPQLSFRHNADWPNNNILASLLYAEDAMDEPFVCCYSDILFTPAIVEQVVRSDTDIALGVDSEWLVRYEHRTEHPSDDAEKVTVANGEVTRLHREIPEADAYGEFIGLAKFSTAGSSAFRKHYHWRREEFTGQPFREAKVFAKAYLIHLLQDMIEANQRMAHVDTPGGYIEVDTQQDFEYAREFWTLRHLKK
jgi:choline kinase